MNGDYRVVIRPAMAVMVEGVPSLQLLLPATDRQVLFLYTAHPFKPINEEAPLCGWVYCQV